MLIILTVIECWKRKKCIILIGTATTFDNPFLIYESYIQFDS